MLTINKIVTPSPDQWMMVMEGMRNPMNSWDRMDSYITYVEDPATGMAAPSQFFMGDNDKDLAARLVRAGGVHAKYRRELPVMVSITAPLYWWKEFETYRLQIPNPTDIEFNSCSTMHKITAKEFEISDFSIEHLEDYYEEITPEVDFRNPMDVFEGTRRCLNFWREEYLKWGRRLNTDIVDCQREYAIHMQKCAWWQIIQTLPTTYNQTRLVTLNYESMAGIRKYRDGHRLDEWHPIVLMIDNLPNADAVIHGSTSCVRNDEGKVVSGRYPMDNDKENV